MALFKTASRAPEALTAAKQELDDIFSIVKGPNGRINPKAVKELDQNRYEISELIVSLIQDTYTVTDVVPYFAQPVTGDFKNDYIWRKRDSNLRVVNRSYGTKPLSQRLTFKEYTISTSMKEVAVELPLEEIAAGSTTASQVTDAIADAILRDRLSTVLDGIDAGVTAGDDRTGAPGYTLRYTGLTQDNLNHAIDGLLDEGDYPAILSRHVVLNPIIRAFPGFSQDVTTELNRRGVLGVYNGATIITLKDQFSVVDGEHVIPRNRVYLSSGKPGAYWMSKDVSFLNWAMIDPRSSTFGTGVRIEDGMLVFDPYQYRIIEA